MIEPLEATMTGTDRVLVGIALLLLAVAVVLVADYVTHSDPPPPVLRLHQGSMRTTTPG
jgi:hypothetical protein